MAKINLLPWREERRKSQQRHFNGMLGLSLIAGVLLGQTSTCLLYFIKGSIFIDFKQLIGSWLTHKKAP